MIFSFVFVSENILLSNVFTISQKNSDIDSEFPKLNVNILDENRLLDLTPPSSYDELSLSYSEGGKPSLISKEPFKVSKSISTNFTITSPIFIDDDSDFGALGFPGNGTKTNPYRIESFSISQTSGTAIYIQGTSSYFLVKNNYLDGLNSSSIGIHLQSVRNGRVENNTIKNYYVNSIKIANSINNSLSGNIIEDNAGIPSFHTSEIWFVESSMNLFENNIISNHHFARTVSFTASSHKNLFRNNIFLLENGNGILISNSNENTLYNNSVFDISLTDSDHNLMYGNEIFHTLQIGSSSDDNRVKINNFVNNSNANDEGSNNIFSYNYWSSHNALDENPSDGFLDIPYSIGGAPNNEDSYPVAFKITNFLTPPSITFPKDGDEVSDIITIEWESSLDFLCQEINYTIHYSNNSGFSWNPISSQQTSLELSWNTTYLSNGYYQIRITATSSGNDTATIISYGSFSIQNHFLTPLTITFPNDGDVLNGRINIKWIGGEDSLSHQLSYSIYLSTNEGDNWTLIRTGIQTTQFLFDTSDYRNEKHCKIMVQATCFEGLSINGISNGIFIISNEENPMISGIIILLNILIILLFIGILLFLSIQMGKGLLYQIQFSIMKAGVCLGSFTDDGFIIKWKSKNCPFNEQTLLHMIEYTAVMYQEGDYNQIFGPFPQTALIRSKSSEWLFASFGFQAKDESVKDPRIIKEGGIIPIILLVYYPKRFDSKFQKHKEDLSDYMKDQIPTITQITEISTHNIIKIEEYVLNLFFIG